MKLSALPNSAHHTDHCCHVPFPSHYDAAVQGCPATLGGGGRAGEAGVVVRMQLRDRRLKPRLIGVGGATVQGLEKESGCRIKLEDSLGLGDGAFTVHITGPDAEKTAKAKEAVSRVVAQVEEEWRQAATRRASVGPGGRFPPRTEAAGRGAPPPARPPFSPPLQALLSRGYAGMPAQQQAVGHAGGRVLGSDLDGLPLEPVAGQIERSSPWLGSQSAPDWTRMSRPAASYSLSAGHTYHDGELLESSMSGSPAHMQLHRVASLCGCSGVQFVLSE